MYIIIYINIYIRSYISVFVFMKTKHPPGYHHIGLVATHALGHICT